MAVSLIVQRRFVMKKILSLQKLSTHKNTGVDPLQSLLSLLLCLGHD
jgi:hypothetical protein